MLGNLNGMHLLAILAIVLLLFGAPRLPALAKSVGQSLRILRKETGRAADDEGSGSDAPRSGPADPRDQP